MDSITLYSFLLVFVRCSAMLLSSPVFGSQATPLPIRVFTTLAISGALTFIISPAQHGPPPDLYVLAAAVMQEALAGLIIGTFLSFVLQMAQMAGAFIDIQMGLGMSQTLNPVSGVSSTVISQFKVMLATVIFLQINGHHLMFEAFVNSYRAMPLGLTSLAPLKTEFVGMVGSTMLGAIQIAAPILGVSIVVDAALGIMNKAVPQMQPIMVGLPAKIAVGMVALSLTLPALVSGVTAGVDHALMAVTRGLGY